LDKIKEIIDSRRNSNILWEKYPKIMAAKLKRKADKNLAFKNNRPKLTLVKK